MTDPAPLPLTEDEVIVVLASADIEPPSGHVSNSFAKRLYATIKALRTEVADLKSSLEAATLFNKLNGLEIADIDQRLDNIMKQCLRGMLRSDDQEGFVVKYLRDHFIGAIAITKARAETAERERDVARADGAALLNEIRKIFVGGYGHGLKRVICHRCGCVGDTEIHYQFCILSLPHPGAAWLEKYERMEKALKMLYDENVDYITLNNLGDPHHNYSMQIARKALEGAP